MADFDTLAALDLGSNSFHMVIAHVKGEEIQVIDRIKEMVQLAAGLGEDNLLDEDSQLRALQMLEKFAERLRPLSPGSVRAVGTNTLRQALNGADFLERAEVVLGHPVEIISGVEEARLIYLGVAHSVEHLWGSRLVVDIGGGSTEMIIGEGFEPRLRQSNYMGCVSYSRRFFRDGVATALRFHQAEIAARQELQSSAGQFKRLGWEFALGASGTIRAVRDIVVALGLEKSEITLDAMRAVRAHVIDAGSIDAAQLPGLSEQRAPVFLGGLAILIGLFESLGITTMTVSDGALREGVLYDLIGRIHNHDVREETIRALAQRYGVDSDHAERVEIEAVRMLDAVREPWGLQIDFHEPALRWAARIHEIGLALSYSGYQKHGSYLIENSDMPGFSRQDQKLLWAMVRSHRRTLKPHRFEDLAAPYDVTGIRLAMLLRLAVLLHRSRDPNDVPSFEVSASNPRELLLTFERGGLDHNPLTRADLEEEANALRALGVTLTFRDAELAK